MIRKAVHEDAMFGNETGRNEMGWEGGRHSSPFPSLFTFVVFSTCMFSSFLSLYLLIELRDMAKTGNARICFGVG